MQIKNVFLIALLGLSSLSLAARPIDNPIQVATDSKSLIVRLEASSAAVLVQIETAEGTIVYTDNTTEGQNPSFKRYNVSNLVDGSYRLVVRQGYTQTAQAFDVEAGKVTFKTADSKTTFLPVLVQKGQKLDLSFFNGIATDMTVEIYDNAGVKITEKTYHAALVQQRFDLSRLPKGIYFAIVRTPDFETDFFPISL